MKKGMASKEGKRVAQFIVNLSQEFAKPLALMLSPLSQLIKEEDDAEKLNQLRLVQRNAHKFRGLTEKLFDISKLIVSDPVIELQKADLIHFLERIVDSFQEAADSRNVTIHFQSNVPSLFCLFDSQKVRRVFYTLVANGIRFNREGGKLFFHIHYVPGSPSLQVKVSDTGIGIVPEKVPYVFDPFYEDEAHLRLYQSTGLGMYLIKLLVDSMEGEITAESEKDHGSTFTVQLPILKNLSEVHYNNYVFERDLDPEKLQEGAMVLDVDTEEIIDVNLLGDRKAPLVLLVCGEQHPEPTCKKIFDDRFRIIDATSSREALAMATENHPDLVVICESFVELSPQEAVRLFKKTERTAHFPVAVLQKKVQERLEVKLYTEGADAVIDSQRPRDYIFARVRSLLDSRKTMLSRAEEKARQKFLEIKTVSLDEAFINRLNAVIEKNIDNEKFDMQKLSQELFMSRTQVHRKLKAIAGKSTTQYIRDYKLTRARQDLANRIGTVSEIAYRYGFSSPAYFTRIFKEHFGHTPSEVKQAEV
ncbi:MAG: helix-turn-helix domain-containing protein [Bacteroidota bacterium]|nr:helix-turn-helix domain-containing protein [Bacteroidota bacterium]